MNKFFICLIICLILYGCSNSVSPEIEKIIYSNSFEQESDFENWDGIGSFSWKSDVPDKGGKKSIYISGGCDIPHAYYIFNDNIVSGYYSIECWGKAIPNTYGGRVSLEYLADQKYTRSSVSISFGDSIWTHKISDTLYFNNSSNLTIQMNAGGIVHSAMLVDNLVVKKVK